MLLRHENHNHDLYAELTMTPRRQTYSVQRTVHLDTQNPRGIGAVNTSRESAESTPVEVGGLVAGEEAQAGKASSEVIALTILHTFRSASLLYPTHQCPAPHTIDHRTRDSRPLNLPALTA